MTDRFDRRDVLKTGAAVGLGGLGFLNQLPPLSADETKLDPKVVRLDPASSRWCGCSKRRRATAARRSRRPDQEGAELPRGARGAAAGRRAERPAAAVGRLQVPRVLVVNSAHLASLASPRRAPLAADLLGPRLLQSGAGARRAGRRLDDGAGRRSGRPAGAQGPRRRSSTRWTPGTRRRPTRRSPAWPARPSRTKSFELFCPLRRARLPLDRPQGDLRRQQLPHARVHRLAARRAGAAVAGLRPADARRRRTRKADDAADRPCRRNSELVKKIRDDWQDGKLDDAATSRLLDTLRTGTPTRRATRSSSCSTAAWRRSRSGTRCSSASGELLMRQPGIVALHA